MKKSKINWWIVLFAGLVIILLVGKDYFLTLVVKKTLKQTFGIEARIQQLSLMPSTIQVKGLVLSQPAGFPGREMMVMPELYLNIALGDLLKQKIYVKELRINLKQFTIVRDKSGRLNTDVFKPKDMAATKDKNSHKKPAPGFKFHADRVLLNVGEVYYTDYTARQPQEAVFKINLQNAEFKNIDSLQALGAMIASQAVMNTTISGLLDFGSVTGKTPQNIMLKIKRFLPRR